MKLFGNTSGKHVRTPEPPEPTAVRKPAAQPRSAVSPVPAPQQKPAPAPQQKPRLVQRPEPEPEPEVTFETVEAPPPPPPVATEALRSETGSQYAAPAPAGKRSKAFLAGYLIYVLLFLAAIAVALTYLWKRMEVYELSRPYKAMDAWLAASDSGDWRQQLSARGVEESYLETLDFSNVEYYKKLDAYTDAVPAYGIRFGKKTMLTVTLKPGAPLNFNAHAWEIDQVSLVDSGLLIYAPEDAVISVSGVPVSDDCLVERDAQRVTLGVFDQAREDVPGLSKFELDNVFGVDNVTVTDGAGNTLELAYTGTNAYYYAPVTSGYVITAPSAVTVTVNGIALTEENAEIASAPLEDFEGIEESVPVVPEERTYTIDGLVLRPVVEASFPDGTALAPTEETEEGWSFALQPDEALAAEQKDFILAVFDNYIAYLGNRGDDLYGNYLRYSAYLVPGSEAADRALRAQASLYWVHDRDTHPTSVLLGDVFRYDPGLFTAQVRFTMENGEDNSYLFVFVQYNGLWRVVRVMNKSSMV